jgi:hypothetical protein
VAQLSTLGGKATFTMNSTPDLQHDFGRQIIRGLSAGCIVLMLVEFLFYLGFHFGMPSLASVKTWEATRAALGLSGALLLIASLIASFTKPKLAVWGLIVGVSAVLAAILPADFIQL